MEVMALSSWRRLFHRVWSRDDHNDLLSHEDATAARIAELTASRRAIADAYEVERRRIENDLHDGAQQYFVAASLKLGEAELEAEDGSEELRRLLDETRSHLDDGLHALRETVHGIHPQVLRDQGLYAAVQEIAESYGSNVIVRCPYDLPTLYPSVLAAAYFFCAECLTNAAKYAPGVPVTVLLISDQDLRISVVDEGNGGAHFGQGLTGMRERLAAFGGSMSLHSPSGGPTKVVARIPVMLNRGQSGYPPSHESVGSYMDSDRRASTLPDSNYANNGYTVGSAGSTSAGTGGIARPGNVASADNSLRVDAATSIDDGPRSREEAQHENSRGR